VQFFSFVGLKKPAGGWQPGAYRGVLHLLRGDAAVIDLAVEIQIP